jgi:hypothetical protein
MISISTFLMSFIIVVIIVRILLCVVNENFKLFIPLQLLVKNSGKEKIISNSR